MSREVTRLNPQIRLNAGNFKWILDYQKLVEFPLSLQTIANMAIERGKELMPNPNNNTPKGKTNAKNARV